MASSPPVTPEFPVVPLEKSAKLSEIPKKNFKTPLLS
jgi:hypothetical protein